jgi:hypothetical protein
MDRGFVSEKASSHETMDGKNNVQVYTLDQKRKAALADVDNAKFS